MLYFKTMTDQTIMKRRSYRTFSDRPVEEDVERSLLEMTLRAPSGGNMQLWSMIRVRDEEKKRILSQTCDNQPFIAQAPMVLVFLADCKKWYDAYRYADCNPREPGVGDLLLAVSDANIAAQNAVTAAESLGLGSCYIGDIMEHAAEQRRLLHLPDYVFPAAMVVFGYPTEQQRRRPKPTRCPMEQIVHENRYRILDEAELRHMLEDKAGEKPYEAWLNAFCQRKYNSDFSREMTRSVAAYLRQYHMPEED